MLVPGLRWGDSRNEATKSRLLCCFHLQPDLGGILSAMWGPLQETTRTIGEPRQCVHSGFRWCTGQRCAVLQSAREQKSLRKPGLGKEQGQLSDDSEVPRHGRNLPPWPSGFCRLFVWLSSPTPLLPTEPYRKAGEVNFQHPPEFLLTFLGVLLLGGAFYSLVRLGSGDSPPFDLQRGLERHSFVISPSQTTAIN